MSNDVGVRAVLLNYLLMVKEFYTKLYTPEIMTKTEALVPKERILGKSEPVVVSLARSEKWWVETLLSCLSVIEQMLTNIERWRDWFLALVENLNFKDKNLQTLTKGPEKVLSELKRFNIDEGYVRLLVNNATSDFMDLVAETRNLLNQLVKLEVFLKRLESPVLDLVGQRLDRIKEIDFMDLLNQMQQLLVATYNAPTKDDFLRNLGSLLHIFGGWRRMLQLDDPNLDDPSAVRRFIKEARRTMNQLTEITKAFKGFVRARELSDYYIRQAELSVIRMMLSYEGNPDNWWNVFIEASSDEIADSMPNKLDAHQLLIGVTHSLALLEDLDQRMSSQMPGIKTSVTKLGEFLESPAVKLYDEIIQVRLSLWDEYQPKWISMLVKLRTELHGFIKKHE